MLKHPEVQFLIEMMLPVTLKNSVKKLSLGAGLILFEHINQIGSSSTSSGEHKDIFETTTQINPKTFFNCPNKP